MENYKYITNKTKVKSTIKFNTEINEFTAKEFMNEFEILDSYSDEIEIYINSGGGSVIAGYSMFSTIYNAKAFTTSIIEGISASMSSIIMLAANRVVASDYSIIMIHDPFNPNDSNPSKKEKNILSKFKNSLLTIYKAKTSKDDDFLSKLMKDESYFDAYEALDLGLVDEVVVTDLGKLSAETKLNIVAQLKKNNFSELDSIYRQNTKTMNLDKLINKFSLDKEATVEDVLNAVESIEKALTKTKAEAKGLSTKLEDSESTVEDLNAKISAFEDKEKAAKVEKINSLVENAITERKVKASTKDEWVALATADYESTKSVLDGLSKLIKFSDALDTDEEETKPFKAQSISDKLNKNIK